MRLTRPVWTSPNSLSQSSTACEVGRGFMLDRNTAHINLGSHCKVDVISILVISSIACLYRRSECDQDVAWLTFALHAIPVHRWKRRINAGVIALLLDASEILTRADPARVPWYESWALLLADTAAATDGESVS